jgi:Acyl-CoA dehydrogenase, N-terminal domain
MVAKTDRDAAEIVFEVGRLEPIIREHAATAERERRLAPPVAQALSDAGLYRLWRPRALGGFELDPIAAFRVLEAVARIDGAAERRHRRGDPGRGGRTSRDPRREVTRARGSRVIAIWSGRRTRS